MNFCTRVHWTRSRSRGSQCLPGTRSDGALGDRVALRRLHPLLLARAQRGARIAGRTAVADTDLHGVLAVPVVAAVEQVDRDLGLAAAHRDRGTGRIVHGALVEGDALVQGRMARALAVHLGAVDRDLLRHRDARVRLKGRGRRGEREEEESELRLSLSLSLSSLL